MSQAIIDPTAHIGKGTLIWDRTKIRENVEIGEDCSLGIGVYVGPGVLIGNQVLIQNGAQIYEPAKIERQVFIGPNVVLTNDRFPRAVDRDGHRQTESSWQKLGVKIGRGASIGANSVCIGPIEIGDWSMVGAGSVVTRSIPNFAVHFGNPAKFAYWIGVTGKRLIQTNSRNFKCPDTGDSFILENENLLVKL
jgi:UDP-2-acetamido-3-amino-2,3-dideoxy-glucuronate N-acetyltransferase